MRIHAAVIRYFDAVWRAGSIREAARRLNVASSAVNRQILKLEAEIGTPLFDRLPSGLKLTAAGEALARHVITVTQDLERARSDIEALLGGRDGHISIATVEGVCGAVLPDVISIMRRTAPRVTSAVTIMGSLTIPAAVAKGDADIGVAFALPRTPDLRQIAIGRFRMGAIMSPAHELARYAKVTLAACLDYPVIVATPDLSISQILAPAMARLSRPIRPILTANSIELMRELAQRGEGLAFQTRLGLERLLAGGDIVHVPLDEKGPVWSDLGVYVRAGRSLPAALDSFLQALVAVIRERERAETAALG